MSDYHDCNENLAFPPEGDWAETKPFLSEREQKALRELLGERK